MPKAVCRTVLINDMTLTKKFVAYPTFFANIKDFAIHFCFRHNYEDCAPLWQLANHFEWVLSWCCVSVCERTRRHHKFLKLADNKKAANYSGWVCRTENTSNAMQRRITQYPTTTMRIIIFRTIRRQCDHLWRLSKNNSDFLGNRRLGFESQQKVLQNNFQHYQHWQYLQSRKKKSIAILLKVKVSNH
jgi:hypothetical protein